MISIYYNKYYLLAKIGVDTPENGLPIDARRPAHPPQHVYPHTHPTKAALDGGTHLRRLDGDGLRAEGELLRDRLHLKE